MCMLIGLSAAYYPIFAIIILVLVGLLTMFIPTQRRAGSSSLLAALLVGFFLLLSLTPAIVFMTENGRTPDTSAREAHESEYYGLSLAQMVLPATNHRLQELANAKQRFLSATVAPSEDSQSLGMLGTAGLAICLISLLLLPMGRPKWVQPLIPEAGLSIVLAFLVASVGGVAILIATFVTPQIRAWNRISIFIAFFALVGFALLLGQLFSYLEQRGGSRVPTFLISSALMVFALWDQTPARGPEQFRHDLISEEFEADQELVSQMETRLPSGARVFQTPYLEYPEGFPPPWKMDDYDPLRGYLHSTDLQWSYGAMKSRAADISACVSKLPIPALVRVVDAWGFSALWIDTFGYPAGKGQRVVRQAASTTRSKPIQDASGRFKVFFIDSVSRLPQDSRRELQRSLPKDGEALQDCRPIRTAIRGVGL